MIEAFFRDNHYSLTMVFEFIAAMVGLFCLRKFRKSPSKYFIYFLISVVIADFIGSYPYYIDKLEWLDPIYQLIKGTMFLEGNWWTTLFWSVGSALFYAFYFRKVLKHKRYRRTLGYASILLVFVSVISISLDWESFMLSSIISIELVSFGVIIMASSFYLIETINSEQILSFYKSLNFYIAVTILIWKLVTTPLLFYDMYLTSSDWAFVLLKWKIILFFNMFMYLTFSLALIACKPEEDSFLKR